MQICNNAKKPWHSYLPDPRMASHLQSCSGFSGTHSHRSVSPILPSNNKYNQQCGSLVCRLPFFLANLRQTGSYNSLPAPLGCNTPNAEITIQRRTAVNKSSFFFMMIYYQSQSRIHKIHDKPRCIRLS